MNFAVDPWLWGLPSLDQTNYHLDLLSLLDPNEDYEEDIPEIVILEDEPEPNSHLLCRTLNGDSLRWTCPRLEASEPKEASAPEHAAAVGSIGQLFTNDGYANLLSLVLNHVPDDNLLRLSVVCKNVGLVISKSAQAQLRLRKLFHAVRPDEILNSPSPPPVNQLAWLLERELRTEKVRPHHAPLERFFTHAYRQLDGAHFSRLSGDDARKLMIIIDTNNEQTTMPVRNSQETNNRLPIWRYQLDSETVTAVVSAKDDLMIQAYHCGTIPDPSVEWPHDIWRVQFCRMRPTGEAKKGGFEFNVAPHPLARIPYIDFLIPGYSRQRKVDIKVGPCGLLLVSFCYDDGSEHQVTVILDWIKGEGRGRVMTSVEEGGKQSHAFVNQEYLISAAKGDLGRPSEGSSGLGWRSPGTSRSEKWADLWLWPVPQEGQRPAMIGTPSRPRYAFYWKKLRRIEPEVSFELPELSCNAGWVPAGSSLQDFYVYRTSIYTTPSAARELATNEDLALFSFAGAVYYRNDPSRICPAQCCGVVQARKLIDVWKRTRWAEIETLSSFGYARRAAERRIRYEPIHQVAWPDWQQWSHIFTLNSYLEPVLHGTKVIVGYSPKEEVLAPRIPSNALNGPYGVKFNQIVLAIRDFNTNRLAHPRLRPWHKLGVPLSHPSQPTRDNHDIPDCTLPTLEVITHGITRGPAQKTRGMFVDKVIRGGLQYHEVTASPAVGRYARFARAWRAMGIQLDAPGSRGSGSVSGVVERIMYDGETILLDLPETAVTIELGPRRDQGGPCCLAGKSSRKTRNKA